MISNDIHCHGMTTDERLMFHISQGYLRRWSLWAEVTACPTYAIGEEIKWQMFQSWRTNPYKILGNNPDGSEQIQYHPMAEFENWPYWLILDLARYTFRHEPFDALLIEPEQLKEAICDVCDSKFSDNEEQTFQQAL